MAKISKRMKKALALGLGVAALSKMGGAGTAAANVDSGRGGKTASALARAKTLKGDDKMATAKKLMTSDAAGKVATKAKTIKSSNPFKMFGVKEMPSESNIAKFKAANKRQIERRKAMKMGDSDRTDVPGFFGMKFKKPLFKSGGSVMAKCKLGRNKKTKIY
ncbi:hypothetical protein N9C16_07700 [Paracoccaceae bacterium]|nr:hypothetical protein [Paracoccaceae bacterium]